MSSRPFQLFWDRAGMLVVFALLFAGCSVFVKGFFQPVNMESILLSVSTIGIIACTMLFCLAAGAFDLSVGSTVACTGVITAVVINQTNSVIAGVAAGLGAGALIGLVNGLLIARAGINALIATLATMQVVRGLGYKVSGGKSVGVINEDFFQLGNAYFLRLPVPVWICLGCFLVFGFLIARTTFGRNTLALGGNPEAARLAGIATVRLQVIIFTLQGAIAALAGIVLCSRMTSGQPMVAQGLELDVISACVLGGVSLTGGVGQMSHVVAGVLIMGTVRNAMNLLNLQTFDQMVASGLILLAAVAFDRLKQRGAGR
jgi:L-arabinose transport system permease protein